MLLVLRKDFRLARGAHFSTKSCIVYYRRRAAAMKNQKITNIPYQRTSANNECICKPNTTKQSSFSQLWRWFFSLGKSIYNWILRWKEDSRHKFTSCSVRYSNHRYAATFGQHFHWRRSECATDCEQIPNKIKFVWRQISKFVHSFSSLMVPREFSRWRKYLISFNWIWCFFCCRWRRQRLPTPIATSAQTKLFLRSHRATTQQHIVISMGLRSRPWTSVRRERWSVKWTFFQSFFFFFDEHEHESETNSAIWWYWHSIDRLSTTNYVLGQWIP